VIFSQSHPDFGLSVSSVISIFLLLHGQECEADGEPHALDGNAEDEK
jgi:hypothetical protein